MGLHKAVEALLECGARTDIVNLFGETALHSSVRQGDRTLAISKRLLAASHDPEALLHARRQLGRCAGVRRVDARTYRAAPILVR